ncbi:GNAT family N-acetyltransferase [uncultured Pseudokineococcus sp.]|uniref:GNAT family N-acetyltransferase n=1 Tax=uncultured Pseudokineococcus sp. TaxID=1642928 RepID=UPI00261A5416|nr:GNAT family N-acetyltransferase [uncultured Pseudokineococcus sp.]
MHVTTCSADDPAFLAGGFSAWHAALEAGRHHDLPSAAPWPAAQARAELAHPVSWEHGAALSAVGSGAVVGAARADLPQRDNRDVVFVDLAVPGPHRRRGTGTALLRAVCDLAEAEGRPRLLTEVAVPLGADVARWPGTAFAARSGFSLGVADVRRELPLPPDAGLLAGLRAGAAPLAAGYRWGVVRGTPSRRDAAAMAELSSRMLSEAPQDDLVLQPEDVDAGRVLEEHGRSQALRRTTWVALARALDGTTAGYSVLVRSEHEPGVLHQWDTLVLPEHRGHRLGLLLKVDCLARALADGEAEGWAGDLRAVRTYNAASNAPMIAVNEAMGFRPVELLHEMQAEVADVRAALAGRAAARG